MEPNTGVSSYENIDLFVLSNCFLQKMSNTEGFHNIRIIICFIFFSINMTQMTQSTLKKYTSIIANQT